MLSEPVNINGWSSFIKSGIEQGRFAVRLIGSQYVR